MTPRPAAGKLTTSSPPVLVQIASQEPGFASSQQSAPIIAKQQPRAASAACSVREAASRSDMAEWRKQARSRWPRPWPTTRPVTVATGDAATSDLAEFVTDFLDADPTRDPDAGEIALAYLRHLGKPITDASTTSLAQAVTYHLPG